MTYEPRPGTTAQRVIAYLQLQPPGTELLTSQLAEGLGVPPLNIPPCLAPALNAGILRQRKKDGHVRAPAYWSLAEHGVKANGNAQGIHPEQGPQHVLKAEAERPDATDRGAPANASPVGGPTGAGQPAAAGPAGSGSIPIIAFARDRAVRERDRRSPTAASPQPTGLRVALWSDGALVIERGAVLVASLTAEETTHLVKYLDAVLVDRATEAA
jgi:hypothetical protein